MDSVKGLYVQMVMAKVKPDKVREASQILKQRTDETGCAEIQGLSQSLLIESLDEPSRLIWLSAWNSLGEARAFLGSAKYAERVKKIQPYLLSSLEWYGYRVLEDMVS